MHTLVLDVIASETARMPIEKCQRALTQKRTLQGGGLQKRVLTLFEASAAKERAWIKH